MSSTYTKLNYHVVFATKGRAPMISPGWQADLHAYIGGIAIHLKAVPISIGGVEDHIHVLLGLKSTHRIADVIREIKTVSSAWAADREPRFAWQVGYGAFTFGNSELPRLLNYVSRQQEHHRKISSADELRELLRLEGIEYDPLYFE